MPFLRRRGNVVSETDMRRHTILDTESVPQLPPLPLHFPPQQPQPQQQQPPRPQSQQHQKQPFEPPPQEAPQSQSSLPLSQGQLQEQQELQEKEQGQHSEEPQVSASALIQEPKSTLLAVPAQSDGNPDEPAEENPDDPDARPDTPPIQEETPKHRRFSILRFRNASDSQLSLRAKQQAEKPPLCLASNPAYFAKITLLINSISTRNYHNCPYRRFPGPPKEAIPRATHRPVSTLWRNAEEQRGWRRPGHDVEVI
ncbi:sec7 domain-containing protein [Colletotrichum tofieldiae]|nr:sec7 domain-containing protein [Colletotrichum tofieldiae]